MARTKVIIALDVDRDRAKELAEMFAGEDVIFKIGLKHITSGEHAELAHFISEQGGEVFLDGKWNDIPNTVKNAAIAADKLGIRYANVHASCGVKAMMDAVANFHSGEIWAVTVLTSLEENEANHIFGGPSKRKVLEFTRDAELAGVSGVICSPQELELLRDRPEFEDMAFITPGVRPEWTQKGDQKRTMTPGEAVKAGADYLVIGRPITGAEDPLEAYRKILDEIEEAEKEEEPEEELEIAEPATQEPPVGETEDTSEVSQEMLANAAAQAEAVQQDVQEGDPPAEPMEFKEALDKEFSRKPEGADTPEEETKKLGDDTSLDVPKPEEEAQPQEPEQEAPKEEAEAEGETEKSECAEGGCPGGGCCGEHAGTIPVRRKLREEPSETF